MHITVVTPTFNEAGNVGRLIDGVFAAADRYDGDFSVLVVDDSSPDGTAGVVLRAARERPGQVGLLSRPGKDGLGSAYKAGFRMAADGGADRIVHLDADGSHDPHHIPDLLAGLDGGADLAVGSRYVPGGSNAGLAGAHRKLLSRGANFYARSVLGVPCNDLTGGFRAFDVALLERVDLDAVPATGFSFLPAFLKAAHAAGAAIVEVPIVFKPRAHGESKMSAAMMVEGLRSTWAMR